jgi:pentatricopeptide repeat protein
VTCEVQAGVQLDTAIYNSIMRQQAAAGMGPDVLEATLSDMEAQGLIPDRRSLLLLLRAYGRRGDFGGATSVMRLMAQLGMGPLSGFSDVC